MGPRFWHRAGAAQAVGLRGKAMVGGAWRSSLAEGPERWGSGRQWGAVSTHR